MCGNWSLLLVGTLGEFDAPRPGRRVFLHWAFIHLEMVYTPLARVARHDQSALAA